MGFYDKSCLISGLSLKGENARLVLLIESEDGWRPICPIIDGPYNRLGTVDTFIPGRRLRNALEGENPDLEPLYDGSDSQALLDEIARGGYRFDGRLVDAALFHWRVVKAVDMEMRKDKDVYTLNPYDPDFEPLGRDEKNALLSRVLFEEVEPGATWVSQFAIDSSTDLVSLAAWIDRYSEWQPTAPDGQHFDDDIRERCEIARDRVKDHPKLLEWVEMAIADTEKTLDD